MLGFISGLLILFLCQYHRVLIIIALQYSLKSGSIIPPALVFFHLRPFVVLNNFWDRFLPSWPSPRSPQEVQVSRSPGCHSDLRLGLGGAQVLF